MAVFNTIVLFVIGFYILIKGAQVLVWGATSVARLFNVSNWFIGMIIVGIGTSIPEFSINVASVFNSGVIGLTSVIGSNIFNILFILGVMAVLMPLALRHRWVWVDLPLNMAVTMIATAVILLPIFGEGFVGISRVEGYLLTGLFALWFIFMFTRKHTLDEDDGGDYRVFTAFTSLLMILGGLIGVFFGGRWVVEGAEFIAEAMGVSAGLIGLTVVAIGTSVPELAVSIVAAFKRSTGIAVGSILGSNIFDFLGILGVTALIRPIPVMESLRFDIIAVFVASLVLLCAGFFYGKRYTLSRTEGALMVALYIAYIVFLLWRG